MVLLKQYLFQQAFNVLREEGVESLIRKGMRKGKTGLIDTIWSLPIIWRYSFRKSKQNLKNKMSNENNLEDILNTAYTYNGLGLYRTLRPMQRKHKLRKLCEAVPQNEIDTIGPCLDA